MNDAASDGGGAEALAALFAETLDRLIRASVDRRAPWRTPALATIGRDGAPAARTVVLRSVERAPLRLEIHSDSRAEKLRDLAADPRAALLFWDPKRRLQLRATGTARAPDAQSAAKTAQSLSDAARAAYRIEPAPGSPIGAAHAYAPSRADPAFQQILLDITALDVLALDPDGHRRAAFRLPGGVLEAATWLAP